MAIEICPLASGSKGNCVYVSNETSSFLIDSGLSVLQTRKRLALIEKSLNDIDFILITHEHSDHIMSVETLCSVYGIPVIAHEKTFRALRRSFPVPENALAFSTLKTLCGKSFKITPFETSHDVYTVGYAVEDCDSKIVYATDIGKASGELIDISCGADIVMIEANYDKKMLAGGRYPPYLKRRIASDVGHLSNDDSADAILKMAIQGTKKFILGHLSEENNLPSVAFQTVCERLTSSSDCDIRVAKQSEPIDFLRCKNDKV